MKVANSVVRSVEWLDRMKAARKVGLRVVRWVASTVEMMAEKMDVR